jgi:hypothetical protein
MIEVRTVSRNQVVVVLAAIVLAIVVIGWIAARTHLVGHLAQPQQVPSQTQQQTPPQPPQ